MCQAFAAENRVMKALDMHEIHSAWAKHKSGERRLTPEQIHELMVRKLMLEDE